MTKHVLGFPTRSDTNRTEQLQKMPEGLKCVDNCCKTFFHALYKSMYIVYFIKRGFP